jgi:hypothetical protein
VFDDTYRLAWDENSKPGLYNYKKDPGEKIDILKQYPERAEKLKKEFDSWWEVAKKEMVNDLHQIKTGNIRKSKSKN